MSEVDTPIKVIEPVNSVNLTEANQVDVYSCDSPDKIQSQLSVTASPPENRQVKLPVFFTEAEPAQKDLAALAPSDLVALIEELRFSNSNLLNRVNELSQVQTESHKAVQLYKERAYVAESMLSQQTQELAAIQIQVSSLFQELEANHQTAQIQQILIENLTAQLESSQERVAHLERECSLTQASYNEQSYQLVQTENTCRELRTRLTRQQRLSVQFKVALEKCLEVGVPSYQSQTNTKFPQITTKIGQPGSQSFFPKAQPIQPWSAYPQFPTALEADDQSNKAVEDFDILPLLPLAESPDITDSPELQPIEDTTESEAADWQDLISLLEAVEEHSPQEATVAPSPLHPLTQLDESDIDSDPVSPDQNEQLQFNSSHEDGNQEDADLGGSQGETVNWPSPIVYPLRPPKGRKSLAAIELPTFSPISAQELRVSS